MPSCVDQAPELSGTGALLRKALRFTARNTRSIKPLYNFINEHFYCYIRDRYPSVLTEAQTIERILAEKLSFSRYGDGEFKLCRGASIARQPASPELRRRLHDILQSDSSSSFAVGIPPSPDNRITNPVTDAYLRKFYLREWEAVHHMASKTYLSAWAFWPRHWELPDDDANRLLSTLERLWQNKDVTFVCNKRFKEHSAFAPVFGNAKSHSFVHTPAKNAYSRYDDLLEQAADFSVDNLFLLACGPTATVLAYDLAAKGYQAIDVGDLLIRVTFTP